MSIFDDPANFISDALHVRPVVLADGKPHDIHFREVDAATYQRFLATVRSKDDDERAMAVPALIAASVRNPDGSQAMTVEKAAKLKPAVSTALANIVLELNPVSYTGNGSTPGATNGSGTSSPSRSVDAPSPSGSG